ncbi:MAG: hypothetical protein JWP97_3840 [Labilithrix sp.]|nr:hypothetical protein [Labilithrix sp.]
MNRRARTALAGIVAALAVAQGCHRESAPPLGLVAGSGGPLTFPPPDDGWSERAPLPESTSAVTLARDPAVKVTDPVLDAAGHFETKGQAIRLWFSEEMVELGADARKKKPALPQITITPAVAGRTVWTYGSEVEFRAEKPFDPAVTYTLEIPEMTAPSGKKLAGGFKATFRSDIEVEVAGKTITYVPQPGKARPIVVNPQDGSLLGGSHAMTAVYDQPIDLGLAQRLVTVTAGASDGPRTKVPVRLRHPEASAYEGQKIDPRFLVVVEPTGALEPGTAIHVEARSQRPEDEAFDASFTIAAAPVFAELACNGDCEPSGPLHLTGGSGSTLRVHYSNPLSVGYDVARKHVTVTPPLKSLYVSGYEDLEISGSFAPSTTYRVRAEGMHDQYGSAVPPVAFTFTSRPLPASVAMDDGFVLLDEPAARTYPVTTRNVARGELLLWALPKSDVPAYAKALHDAGSGVAPAGDPVVVPFTPRGSRDQLVETSLDLSAKVERGRAYVAQVRIAEPTRGAVPASYASGSEAGRPSTAVLFAAGPGALAAHVHRSGDRAAVQVFRLGTGEPVANAHVAIGAASATTDPLGSALLDVLPSATADERVLAVTAGDAELLLPLEHAVTESNTLFPELTLAGDANVAKDAVGLVVTDRGIYRPGSSLGVKGYLRSMHDATIVAKAATKVRLRVVDPLGSDVVDEALVTSARGGISRTVDIPKTAHTGRFQVRLELDDGKHTLVAAEAVRVAEFEAPRFKVDVEAKPGTDPQRLAARIVGRYLFGAAMGGAKVSWVLKKTRVPVKGGTLWDAGLTFEKEHSYWDDEAAAEALRPVTGEGVLADDGSLAVDAVTGPLADGPTEVTLEADVSDASNRHVSGTLRTTKDPYALHAGLHLRDRFAAAGQPLRVELGAVDAAGNAVSGRPMKARLERLTWTRAAEKAESGAVVERWKYLAKTEASCTATSGAAPAPCDLPVPHGGSFRVVAHVDGGDEAATWFYSYGDWSPGESAAVPGSGKKVPLVLDKARYKAGETARVLVQSPFAKATALVTFEQGGIVGHRSLVVEGPRATIDVPVTSANAPWLHVAVTLLPTSERAADYRVGVVRVPVGAEDARLEVKVASAKRSYEVRDDAEITVEVRRNGQPVRNADVTLGVVDEGILRMTAYHPRDPVTALRPGRGLEFGIVDSRASLLRRREKAHTAGGGDSEGEESLDTRRSFVETAAWLPDLVTDQDGIIRTKVKLPDNLTEFRMTAVVLDEQGAGGTAESSFVVTRPLLLEPVMPRFALRGDAFEAAALVHNNTDADVKAHVTIAGQPRDVVVPTKGRARVAAPLKAEAAGTRTLAFSLEVGGALKDKVEVPLRVDEPGIEEHPMIAGVFGERQEVQLAIPADAVLADGAALSIKTGSALYPELGQRLSYLLDYPHGCVEQTTSSTIPLLAARTILPWTGTSTLDDAELKKRIEAGVARLATMQTPGGGLAYWPGDSEPNVFGSAYALRALLRAKEAGIERPRLIEGVTKFLVSRLADDGSPDLRMSVADVLAQAHELPASSADALFGSREKLDSFGLASLALALSSLPNQTDRVREVLDALESSFDAAGAPTKAHDKRDWHYWASDDRDRSQAVIALVKLRRGSRLLPVLAGRLAKGLDRYSTQSTAWSLLALSDFVGARSPEGNVDVAVKLEGRILDTYKKLGGDNKEVRIALSELRGKKVTLVLSGDPKTPSAFALEARYKRPLDAGGGRIARRDANGVSIHRAYSDAAGKQLALSEVKAGQVVRVAVRIDLPKLDSFRLGYLAVTDRLPAGFEPIDTDLATSGSLPELDKDHPFHEGLSSYGQAPSHIGLRDDRVQLYFDHVYGDHAVYASYLARATTPGSFTVPPASGELMYESDSQGYSDAAKVVVQ